MQLEQILQNADVNTVLISLMPALCEVLNCDRCFLEILNPATRDGLITHCYSRSPEFPDLTGTKVLGTDKIETLDPLMAIAYRTPEPVFVEDIETAGPDIINLAYEQEVFGSRALIHIPIYWDGELYGILEPCVFGSPRVWTADDRATVDWLQTKLPPLVFQYFSSTVLTFI